MSDSDASDYEEASDMSLGKLTDADFDRVRQRLSDKCSAVNAYLLSSREPVDKRRLIETTLQDLVTAFNQVSAAYLQLSASSIAMKSFKSIIRRTVKDQVAASIKDQVAASIKDLLPSTSTSNGGLSYAEAASKATKLDLRRVKVPKGPTVIVPNTVSVVIGPKSDNAHNFDSADTTRKAVMKAVNPSEVNLRINKHVNSRNKSVRTIAENIDVEKLKSSPNLAAAGLEIKEREKLNPRMVIRGVPKDVQNADLLADIKSLNFDGDCPADSIKIVYRYPPRANNDLASVVIETSPDLRRRLLNQGRV